MVGSEMRAPSRPLRLAELLALGVARHGPRDRSASRPRAAHLHDRHRPRRGDGMRSGRRPHRPPVRAPPLSGLHVRRGGDRRHGRRRRAGLQRRDGSGRHGLGPGDAGTTRAQRRPRPAPDAASPARRSGARRSEGRGAFAVRRTARSPPCWPDASVWSSRSSTPSPMPTSAGTGRAIPTDLRETPSRSRYASPPWRETPISQPARRRPTRVDERAKRAGLRPCGRRCLRAGRTRRALRARRRGRVGDRAGARAGTRDHRRPGHARRGPCRVRRLRRPQVALDPRPFARGRLARRGGGPPRRTRRRRVRRPAAGGSRSRPRPGRRRERDLGQAGSAHDLGVGAGAAPPLLHRADPRPVPFARVPRRAGVVAPRAPRRVRVPPLAPCRGPVARRSDPRRGGRVRRPHRPTGRIAPRSRTTRPPARSKPRPEQARRGRRACVLAAAGQRAAPRRPGGRPTSPTGRSRCCA